MNKDMKNLINLQDIDIQIIELEKSKEQFPVTLTNLEKDLFQAQEAVKNANTKMDETKEEKKKTEEHIIDAKLSLEKSQKRLNLIKTNKEYDAVHAEIETFKHIVTSGEKRIQKYNTDTESIEELLIKEQDALDEKTTENQPQISDLKAKIAMIDSSISDIKSKREKLVLQIPQEYVHVYDHIRSNRKNGKVLSIVNSTERTCTVCYLVLQPQVIHEIRGSKGITFCPSCGSIFIWEDDVLEEEI